VRREAVQASRAQLNQGLRAVWNRLPWGVRECLAERLGPPTWMVTETVDRAGGGIVWRRGAGGGIEIV
jgi:hypothetical protein